MNAELNKALKSPMFAEKVVPSGVTVIGGTPEQFAEHIRRETEKWGAVIKAAGIKAD
jgi:tripartite-type tricarboxylate transporter receptor subunit TctC